MSDSNTTRFTNPSFFILLGIPGLEDIHVWISIPFCVMYSIAVLGNISMLLIVRMELSLHTPMYYFVCMLAGCNLIVPTSAMPKVLSIFWFNSKEIDISACFTQLYFMNCFLVTETGILVALAFDRYVAICDPLRHSTILTKSVVGRIGLAALLRGVLTILPQPFLARKWTYCTTNIIAHTYCDHAAILKLVCNDIRISNYYELFALFLMTYPDVSVITFSYIQILRAVFNLPTKEARRKTFGTCASHLCVLLTYFVPSSFSVLTHKFGHNVPLYFHVITANIYILVPPMLNPIIYGLRTKQIRERLLLIFSRKRS